jgi:hypothetical protein
MSEHDEQVTFFDWVRLNRQYAPNLEVRKAMKLCYANQTGAHMVKAQAGKMKAEGMTKGILDINLDWPLFCPEMWDIPLNQRNRDNYNILGNLFLPGLRIEMKFGKNKLTKEQKEKKELLEEVGFKVAVCYSAVEAIRAVFEYLPFEESDYQGIKEFLK